MSRHHTAGYGTPVILLFFGVIPLIIFGVAVFLDGRPHNQKIVITALSGGSPLSGTPVRVLVDQGATCDGEAYEVTSNGRGIAEVSHGAKLGVLTERAQSVAVCLPDKDEWVLAWSSHHGSAEPNILVACDATNPSAPGCEATFEE